jgi:hypothetical protein
MGELCVCVWISLTGLRFVDHRPTWEQERQRARVEGYVCVRGAVWPTASDLSLLYEVSKQSHGQRRSGFHNGCTDARSRLRVDVTYRIWAARSAASLDLTCTWFGGALSLSASSIRSQTASARRSSTAGCQPCGEWASSAASLPPTCTRGGAAPRTRRSAPRWPCGVPRCASS